jgi:hypothetical protein
MHGSSRHSLYGARHHIYEQGQQIPETAHVSFQIPKEVKEYSSANVELGFRPKK